MDNNSLVPGDLVEFRRSWLFSHWAVYIGEENVVHQTGECNPGSFFSDSSVSSMEMDEVRMQPFLTVAGKSKAFKNNRRDSNYGCDEIVARALSKLGVSGYNLVWDNSEHFAAWCRYGEGCSEQAQTIWTMFFGSMAVIVGGIAALTGLRR
ncbi:phospholipid-metabolizing enzyme A-C1-like [Lingula anatina]|uniref:Phospholipid-metabolizing enzyme A-C1-like n=1 Tax=Lingula anatina TaxID=7574 RepID=A0A2R2MIM8_LINAN|nr:phospholipid-metabolizing enzyme A-C1-like [Lingula anatina]|eukprot:XP_023930049.1 phospholipid-metabolizing enzyme A-C1-like [Lingula anatina]